MSDATVTAFDGRTRRRERNAVALYDAAAALLATRSFDDVSVDEICARAGVGRATFFRIYETKAGLLREFNRRVHDDASARLAAVGAVDIRAGLEHVRAAIVDAWRDAGPGYLGMAREFARSAHGDHPHAAHPELLALVVDLVSRAVERGELSDAVPAGLAARIAMTNLAAPIAHVMGGHDADVDELSHLLLDQWLNGMQSLPPMAVGAGQGEVPRVNRAATPRRRR